MRDLARIKAELIRHRRRRALLITVKCALARSIWAIDAPKFLMLGMYDQPMRRWADSMDYHTGLEPVLRMINWQGDGKQLTVDKLITAERLAMAGITSAPLIAVIGRDSVAHPHGGCFPQWSSADEIARALPSCPDHLFVKPAIGWRGDGILGPERRYNRWAVSGKTMSDRELAEHLLQTAPPSGLLLQKRVRSHHGLAPIGGDLGLGTVRINTALTLDGTEIFFIFAKIMGSESLVDNFSGGKFGNMLARVDKYLGKITHVFGRKRDQRLLMEPVTEHPVTRKALVGFQLPLWDETVALAKQVATAFPEAPLIGADIAITNDGPLIIEVQSDWDANVGELVIGGGLRPLLRDVIPRLALSDALKQEVMAHIALSRRAQRRKLAQWEGVSGEAGRSLLLPDNKKTEVRRI
jgi:hypothetical protein